MLFFLHAGYIKEYTFEYLLNSESKICLFICFAPRWFRYAQ